MNSVGYARLQESLGLSIFPLSRPARVQPVTRIEQIEATLAAPANTAPFSRNRQKSARSRHSIVVVQLVSVRRIFRVCEVSGR
ncbi:hypothetical protein C0J56_29710 [Pseudomonas fluorescens]|nr:hypothetical protein C0J56_29710 [Pseudomonas fluorescens]